MRADPATDRLEPAGPQGREGRPGRARRPALAGGDGDPASRPRTRCRKAKLGKPKVSSKQAQKVVNLEPAPGEAFQFLRSAQVQLKDWFKTEEYTYVGRLVLPKGRLGMTLTARASATAGAPDYPSTYQGRVRCVVGTPRSSDSAEGQGVIALQRAVTLQKAVSTREPALHRLGRRPIEREDGRDPVEEDHDDRQLIGSAQSSSSSSSSAERIPRRPRACSCTARLRPDRDQADTARLALRARASQRTADRRSRCAAGCHVPRPPWSSPSLHWWWPRPEAPSQRSPIPTAPSTRACEAGA